MKRLAALSVVGATFAAGHAFGGEIDPALQELIDDSLPGATISTLVHLNEQVDLQAISRDLDNVRATLHVRHQVLVTELQSVVDATQGPLVAHLEDLLTQGRIERFQPFWLRNVVRVDTTADEIALLAARNEVRTVFFNPAIELIEPVPVRDAPEPSSVTGGPEPGVVAVRAPEVWAMGFTGSSRLVSSLDTGVDGNHEALASRWRGLDPAYTGNPEWAWFDPVDGTTFPTPCAGSHGTHTMGTVCGGAPGNQIGVAPGAEWIHARVIDCVSIPQTVSDAILAFEWTVDPDGNPATSFDVPDTSSNSWGLADFHGYPDCDEEFWDFLDAVEAVGVVVIFSAGNEGNGGLRRPSDRATDEYRTHAVAAVDGNVPSWPIAGFSSRGPTQCTPDGSDAIKPDISAPGVNVVSAFAGGGIYDTAFDLGAPGEDNDYGYGMIDAVECVLAAIELGTLTISLPGGAPDVFDPAGGTTVVMLVEEQNATADPGTATFYYRDKAGPYSSGPMTPLGGGQYEAVFPELDCLAEVEYYFSIDTTEGDTVFNPFTAPETIYTSDIYSGVATTFEDDFESDLGWTVMNSAGLTAGAWERGTPIGSGDWGDPVVDGDGSGQCYVTGNAGGITDIDGGSTTLTSPVMDATGLGEPVIRYYSWFHNTLGIAPEEDVMVVEVSDDGGSNWVELETIGPEGDEVDGGWFLKEFLIGNVVDVTDTFRIRFRASDFGSPSIVEAGVDGVEIREIFCNDGSCAADVDGDGSVGVDDLTEVILNWGPCPDCPEDIDGDGEVNVGDLTAVIVAWGECP
jgi:hypothetical protein